MLHKYTYNSSLGKSFEIRILHFPNRLHANRTDIGTRKKEHLLHLYLIIVNKINIYEHRISYIHLKVELFILLMLLTLALHIKGHFEI